jgi:hypothetical protein
MITEMKNNIIEYSIDDSKYKLYDIMIEWDK